MNSLIQTIREDLKAVSDEKVKQSGLRFFKEEVMLYGIKSAEVQMISKAYYKQIKDLPKATILDFCEQFWQSGYMEESFIACNWSYQLHKKFVVEDIILFERWVNSYINNWASCDTFCNHTVGIYIEMFPDKIEVLKKWATSSNRWMRRAAAVSLIVPAKKGLFLNDIFEIADILLLDSDDMVQKGYGWMLKVACQKHEQDVFEYVVAHKANMPRTALRYAIEKMPQELKEEAMAKN
jgi:3-methyladenine DNA glycosylase AlkD